MVTAATFAVELAEDDFLGVLRVKIALEVIDVVACRVVENAAFERIAADETLAVKGCPVLGVPCKIAVGVGDLVIEDKVDLAVMMDDKIDELFCCQIDVLFFYSVVDFHVFSSNHDAAAYRRELPEKYNITCFLPLQPQI